MNCHRVAYHINSSTVLRNVIIRQTVTLLEVLKTSGKTMAKIILIILILAALPHEHSGLEKTWPMYRLSCNFSTIPFGNRVSEPEYAACIWNKYNIIKPNGKLDRTKIFDFLAAEFSNLKDYKAIKRGFRQCLRRGAGDHLKDRSHRLWECLKDRDIIGMMDALPNDGTS